ncbi:MAG: hypothetical protein E7270_01090 [Lachnospiraceae bacterium]|nr:hypothetical protein [Lachnospiraceae bacterium]
MEEYVPDIDLTEYYTKTETDDKYALKSDIQSGAVRLDFTVSLPASGWSNTSPYSQSVTVSGISETDWPQMSQDLSMATDDTVDDLEKNYAYIKYGEATLDTITFYCLKGKPTVDLTLIGQVLRGGASNYESAIGVEF